LKAQALRFNDLTRVGGNFDIEFSHSPGNLAYGRPFENRMPSAALIDGSIVADASVKKPAPLRHLPCVRVHRSKFVRALGNASKSCSDNSPTARSQTQTAAFAQEFADRISTPLSVHRQ
jgi:hypothetical protein